MTQDETQPVAYLRRFAAAVAAGLLLLVSLPPWGIWPAAVVGLAVLVRTLEGCTWTQRAALGATAGLVWLGVSLRWVVAYTGPGALLLVLVEAAFPAVASALTPSARGRWVAFPGAVVLMEAVRYRWPLGGLPPSSLVLGQAEGPLGPSVAFVGPLGLLLMLAGAATLLAVASTLPRPRAVAASAAAVAMVAAPRPASCRTRYQFGKVAPGGGCGPGRWAPGDNRGAGPTGGTCQGVRTPPPGRSGRHLQRRAAALARGHRRRQRGLRRLAAA